METKTKTATILVPSIDEHIAKLVEKRNATLDDEEIGERLEALWLSLGLFDHTDYNLDYCYTFKAEADAWAFFRHAVANNPYALDALSVGWDNTLGWSVA